MTEEQEEDLHLHLPLVLCLALIAIVAFLEQAEMARAGATLYCL